MKSHHLTKPTQSSLSNDQASTLLHKKNLDKDNYQGSTGYITETNGLSILLPEGKFLRCNVLFDSEM